MSTTIEIIGRVAVVPKGNYSALTPYDRLDMVKDDARIYIAKKDVPAGTSTSNAEYWMFCGEFSTHIMDALTNGIGRPDNATLKVDNTGQISVKDYGDTELETTNKTVKGAINEIFSLFGTYITYDQANEEISFYLHND